MIDHERLLERFLRYVRVVTSACDHADTYPSSSGQLVLGRMLKDELLALGRRNKPQQRGAFENFPRLGVHGLEGAANRSRISVNRFV